TGEGQYGLEEKYNNILFQEEKSRGDDILLNLDYKIQFMAEKLLAEDGKELGIDSGQIIVIEPETGKILALANFPNFNPNQYKEFAKKDLSIFQNAVTQKIFEPGSVFKPITFAAALNEEKITPETTYVDTGKVVINGWPIRNYGNRVYGETPMTEVLEKSINTGAVFVEDKIGHKTFLDYVGRFGFFEKTNIDLPEIASENKELKKGYEVNFATASFGQGIEVTPIQLVRAYCAIANGGKLVRPYLVNKILDKKGRVLEEIQPEISESSIISQKAARELTAMLVNVVERGFAKRAQIKGYYIAGKTGTAMIPWSSLDIDKKGYSEKTWQSFIGYFPAFDPKILILVKLDNPATKTAEYSAVPIFRKLAEFIINYQQIPPDYQE
ncbi:penicillin-binding protein 2, partial [bacterium]|nr:penicillin-binding protein 2 [bacterium]